MTKSFIKRDSKIARNKDCQIGVNHQKPRSNQQQHNNKVVKNTITRVMPKENLSPHWKLNRPIGPGLVNVGNTCFLNSVLQCLTYSPAFTQYLLSTNHNTHCKKNGFCALCSMKDHVDKSFYTRKSFKRNAANLPRAFTSNLNKISSLLRLGYQEDAHEFLMFLLQAFQKSLTHGIEKVTPQLEESTAVSQIFGGKVRSQIKCHNCKAKINNFEAFLDLSLDLTKANTVEDALKKFTEVDVIGNDPDNRYKCAKCEQKVKVDKQMTVSKLPPMLNLHLKRFTYDYYRDKPDKIRRHVAFPKVLNMASFISKDNKETCNNETIYDLYAVLVHDGRTCSSGHYYAYVKSTGHKWYLMNDQHVSSVREEEVLKQKAYLLFYRQRRLARIKEEKKLVENEKEEDIEMKDVVVIKEEEEKLRSALKRKREEATREEEQEEKAKKNRRVLFEDMATADDPAAWFVQRVSDIHRSLRGVLSPATYGAAVSDDSAWDKNNINSLNKGADKKKRYRRRKGLEGKPLNFTINVLQ